MMNAFTVHNLSVKEKLGMRYISLIEKSGINGNIAFFAGRPGFIGWPGVDDCKIVINLISIKLTPNDESIRLTLFWPLFLNRFNPWSASYW